jgi:O-antigen/teichoic acid export membrane protein
MSLMQVSASAYQIAVEHWLGIKVLGYFVVATAYSRLLAPLGSAIAAHVFRLGISGEKTDIAKVFRFSAIASTACAIPLWLAGPWVIPRVFGGDFAVDHTLIGILMISAMFALLADCLAEYMNGMRLVVPDVMGRLLYLAVLASLSALLVSKIDFLAIAVAMAAGDLARCCFLASRLARKSEFPVIRFIRIEGGEFADFLAVLQRAISKPFIKR